MVMARSSMQVTGHGSHWREGRKLTSLDGSVSQRAQGPEP